jgi:hypothetical protein
MSDVKPLKTTAVQDVHIASLPENQSIDHPDTAFIHIQQGTAIAVNRKSGKIVGAHAEGTLGIVIYGGDPTDIDKDSFKTARAIRIPRLLQSDILLNFHVAEITHHESRQAARFNAAPFLLGASVYFRFEHANPFTLIPGTSKDHPCFIGLYLSPLSHYEVCLVSNETAWPEHFSKYLEENGKTPEKLYQDLLDRCEQAKENVFNRLLFLPDRRGQVADDSDSGFGLRVLNRKTLDADRARRDTGGWWFNIPVAIYPWMTANLERLLAAYLDDAGTKESKKEIASLSRWSVSAWFDLLRNLAFGLKTLHAGGAIHGDPRPANIMTYIQIPTEIDPESFQWIDIGLGYGAKDFPPLNEGTTLTPRPLGGGRSTIFYAPEREEAQEFEDADVISLTEVVDGDDNGRCELRFFWRPQTHVQDVEVLRLKDGDTPLRELGELQKGDRIQVREFLFEVEEVKADHVVVSGIYEIFLDRVLVEKRDDKRELVLVRLSHASISRYRIFKQWSQATDIYGLGIIALYLFFTRGLFAQRQDDNRIGTLDKTSPSRSSIYDRANRERIFRELGVLLRNRSFLENVLFALKTNDFESIGSEADGQDQSAEAARAKNISDVILATDTNFEFIRQGVNENNALFAQVIYFCLCCVWRQDEVEDITKRSEFGFVPFSKSRLMIKIPKELPDAAAKATELSKPAEKASSALIRLITIAGKTAGMNNTKLSAERWEKLGITREEQMIKLREDLNSAEEEVRRCNSAEKKLGKTLEQARSSLDFIRMETHALSGEIKSHKALMFENKTSIANRVRELGDFALEAKHNTKKDLEGDLEIGAQTKTNGMED